MNSEKVFHLEMTSNYLANMLPTLSRRLPAIFSGDLSSLDWEMRVQFLRRLLFQLQFLRLCQHHLTHDTVIPVAVNVKIFQSLSRAFHRFRMIFLFNIINMPLVWLRLRLRLYFIAAHWINGWNDGNDNKIIFHSAKIYALRQLVCAHGMHNCISVVSLLVMLCYVSIMDSGWAQRSLTVVHFSTTNKRYERNKQ